jgi:hypothetical protein
MGYEPQLGCEPQLCHLRTVKCAASQLLFSFVNRRRWTNSVNLAILGTDATVNPLMPNDFKNYNLQ